MPSKQEWLNALLNWTWEILMNANAVATGMIDILIEMLIILFSRSRALWSADLMPPPMNCAVHQRQQVISRSVSSRLNYRLRPFDLAGDDGAVVVHLEDAVFAAGLSAVAALVDQRGCRWTRLAHQTPKERWSPESVEIQAIFSDCIRNHCEQHRCINEPHFSLQVLSEIETQTPVGCLEWVGKWFLAESREGRWTRFSLFSFHFSRERKNHNNHNRFPSVLHKLAPAKAEIHFWMLTRAARWSIIAVSYCSCHMITGRTCVNAQHPQVWRLLCVLFAL